MEEHFREYRDIFRLPSERNNFNFTKAKLHKIKQTPVKYNQYLSESIHN
jgi:hypothetical protein